MAAASARLSRSDARLDFVIATQETHTVREFLDLSATEHELVEMRVALASGLRARRERARLTQTALAKRLNSSQSRGAKMEAGDPSVSLDLLIRSLLILGTSRRELSRIISDRSPVSVA